MTTPTNHPPLEVDLAERVAGEAPSARWLSQVLFAYAAVSGVAALTYGMPPWALGTFVGCGAILVGRAVATRANRAAALGLGASFHQIGRGRLADAQAILAVVDRFAFVTWMRRLADVQRATIAIRRGDFATAVPWLDRAVARRLGRVRRAFDAHQVLSASSMRAFVLASLGAREGAAADIARVRGSGSADADALARVALAEALLLDKAGERDELRALIHRDAELLFEHTHPRERAVVRALSRMLAANTTSVYRLPAQALEPAPGSEEPALADWVERVVPGAGRFAAVPTRRVAAAQSVEREDYVRPTQRGMAAVVAARAAGERAAHERSANFIATVVAFVIMGTITLYVFSLAPQGTDWGLTAGRTSTSTYAGYALAIAMGAAAFVALAFRAHQSWLGRVHKHHLTPLLATAMGRSAEPSGRAEARRELSALTESPSHVVAAQAHLSLAVLAEREADFGRALAHCDQAIARVAGPRVQARAGLLVPDAISLRAFVLAAVDRCDEAQAELAGIPAGYPHRELAVYRTRLVQLVRSGRAEEAARWADEHALDLPLTVREELLTDLVRATCQPEVVGAGEVARLRGELARSEARRRWIEAVAPDLVRAFRHGGFDSDDALEGVSESPVTGVRVAKEPAPRELEDEREAMAEAEARAAPLAMPRRGSR